MKLISMTDFVLSDKIKTQIEMIRYANFLKKPLTLEMFIGDESLFKGWVLIENTLFDDNEDYLFVEDLSDLKIENLVETVTLTQHAIKQLGL